MKNEKLTLSASTFYSVLMAISAALMGLSTFIIETKDFHRNQDYYLLGVFLFSGTFIAYTISSPPPLLDFTKRKLKHRKITIQFLLLLLLSTSLLFFSHFSENHIIQYILAGLFALFYFTGISSKERHFGGIRTLFLVKNITLSLSWALATSPVDLSEKGSILLFLSRFLFVLALSLVIDIRDIQPDSQKRVTTVPVRAGIHFTKISAMILIVSGTAFIYKNYQNGYLPQAILAASIISSICSLFGIGRIQKTSVHRNYLFLIDGNLLLHGILYFLASIYGHLLFV